jgi:hypothetical protein
MDASVGRQPPPGWGNEPLTQYLDTFRGNQLATFANKRSAVIDLTTIDAMFRKLDGALNPRPLLPMEFLQRAHSAYLSACGAVLGGQLHEAQALFRVCLEQGGYALYVGTDQPRWERWMDRHEPRSPTQQKKWKDEFTHGKVVRYISTANADVGRAYTELYDRTIEYGAHPNERGASMSSTLEDTDDGGLRFGTIYLHDDGLMLDFALRTAAQVGICVLRIGQMIYPQRFQATGVQWQLETIAQRF